MEIDIFFWRFFLKGRYSINQGRPIMLVYPISYIGTTFLISLVFLHSKTITLTLDTSFPFLFCIINNIGLSLGRSFYMNVFLLLSFRLQFFIVSFNLKHEKNSFTIHRFLSPLDLKIKLRILIDPNPTNGCVYSNWKAEIRFFLLLQFHPHKRTKRLSVFFHIVVKPFLYFF